MASTFSTDLKLELMATGEKSGLWGDITNVNLNIVQQAIAGFEAISISGGAQTTALTFSNGSISNGKNAVIKFTGTITGNQVVTIPDGIEKTYIIQNSTTGAHTVEFKTVSGTGVTFATNNKSFKIIYSDGTNIVEVELSSVNPIIEKILDTNGNEEIIFTTTGSAVNELTIANAATTAAPTISTTGSDTNIDLRLATKGTGGVVFNAGAVATPSITTTGDTNTGIFFPAADEIAFTEGGVEAMRINSSGNIGIATTTPDAKLSVNGAASFGDGTALLPSIANLGDLNTGIFFPAADTIAFSEGGVEAVRIDSSANLKFNSGFGSVATAYGVRAWVNFNGSGTVAIRESGNVTSITDNGTGNYTVNFTTAMPDANYAALVSALIAAQQSAGAEIRASSTASALNVITFNTSTGGSGDSTSVNVSILR